MTKRVHLADVVQQVGIEKHEHENKFQELMMDNAEYVWGLMSDEDAASALAAIGCNVSMSQSPTDVPSEESFEGFKTLNRIQLAFIIAIARCGFTEFSIMRTRKMAEEASKRN